MRKKTRVIVGMMIFFCMGMVALNACESNGQTSGGTAVAEETLPPDELPTPTPKPTATPTPKPTPTPVPSTNVMIGKSLKKVYEVKGTFYRINNKLKYRQTSGKVYKKGFFLKGKYVYFANKDGEVQRGWKKYKGNVYFFSRKNGRLTSKLRAEGVVLGSYGIAKKGKLNEDRVNAYLKAANTVKKITKSTDEKSTKLYKCYKWVMQYGYVRHRTMRQMMQTENWRKTWDIVFANDIFDKHSGCCVSYSAAFALMAKECGVKKVTLCCDTGHAWDDIGGRLYDPLFAKSRSFEKNYNASYSDYRINPAITKKIS